MRSFTEAQKGKKGKFVFKKYFVTRKFIGYTEVNRQSSWTFCFVRKLKKCRLNKGKCKKNIKPVPQLLTVSYLKGPSRGHDSLVHWVIIANNGVLFVKELNVNEKLYSQFLIKQLSSPNHYIKHYNSDNKK